MCALSYLTLLRNTAKLPPNRIVAMMQVLHYANLAMCAGQGYDIGFETRRDVTRIEYFAMIDGKTAALFGAACELGARAAGCDDKRASAYGDLGRCYGRAFQIRDDVLGTWGSPDETGKPSGSDIARRKWSSPVVWALSGEPSSARDAIMRRYALRTPMESADVRAIVEALDVLGARQAADEAVDAQLRDAEDVAEMHKIDPRSYGPHALYAFCSQSRVARDAHNVSSPAALDVRNVERRINTSSVLAIILLAGFVVRMLLVGSEGYRDDVSSFDVVGAHRGTISAFAVLCKGRLRRLSARLSVHSLDRRQDLSRRPARSRRLQSAALLGQAAGVRIRSAQRSTDRLDRAPFRIRNLGQYRRGDLSLESGDDLRFRVLGTSRRGSGRICVGSRSADPVRERRMPRRVRGLPLRGHGFRSHMRS